ncbi:MAG: hypothetical protein HYX53_15655 [Chloroflexi bacterium]|nr:hypothetical protein [Chloroflexota bacterium]
MSRLSRRDIGGLVILAAALAVAAAFFSPGSGETARVKDVYFGSPVATATPAPAAPTPTPTRVPPVAVTEPTGGWNVRFFRGPSSAAAEDSNRFFTTLDISYPAAPYPDMKDDNWSLTAEANVALPAGLHELRLRHKAEVQVFIDGVLIGSDGDSATPQMFAVTFDHPAGPATIRIEARDRSGAFLLQLQ